MHGPDPYGFGGGMPQMPDMGGAEEYDELPEEAPEEVDAEGKDEL